MPKITDLQFSTLVQLIQEKDTSALPPAQVSYLQSESKVFWQMSKAQASNAISILIKCPKKPVPVLEDSKPQVADDTNAQTAQVQAQDDERVPQGRYFIVDPTDGIEKFFRLKINKPQEGKWKGYTFYNLDVQASDLFYPIRNSHHREAVLTEIAKDPITAMNEYGIRMEHCGRCGRLLTKRSSRLRGLGPICADIIEGVEPDISEATAEDTQMLIELGLLKEGE